MYWFEIRPKIIYPLGFNLIVMQATVRMSRAGSVVIPIEIREALGLKTGDLITIDVLNKVPKMSVQEQGNDKALSLS